MGVILSGSRCAGTGFGAVLSSSSTGKTSRRRGPARLVLGCAVVAAAMDGYGGTANAGSWSELVNGGGDAGDTFAAAQVPAGANPLTSIVGTTATTTDGDFFRIYVPDPANFTASTVGGASHDTILYLFAPTGELWVAQDDDSGLRSTIFFGGALAVPAAGEFYLGITPFNLSIEDANGVDFFAPPGFVASTATSPVTSASVTLWQNTSWQFDHFEYFGDDGGPYTINLAGAQFVPEPATPLVLLGIGAATGFMRRRR